MMALAIGYTIRGALRLEWGNETINPSRPYPQDAYLFGNVVVTTDDVVICGFVLLLLIALFLLLQVTPLGKVIQATFQSQRGAALVGINVPLFHALMWGGGAALGAVGGVMLSLITPLTPDLGQWTLVQGFAAMTLGGLAPSAGRSPAASCSASPKSCSASTSTPCSSRSPAIWCRFSCLMLRPQGLFGRRVVVRV